MKRFHIHVSVASLDPSITFYSALFGSAPTVHKPDYAKWELDEPQLNFAISTGKDRTPGINHLGIQVTEAEELGELYSALQAAQIRSAEEVGANCCYARSDKHWLRDPEGIVWEAFHTMGSSLVYGEDLGPNKDSIANSKPAAQAQPVVAPANACCPTPTAAA